MTAPDHGDEEINRLVALCAERPDDAIEYAIEYGMILARRASTPSSIEATPSEAARANCIYPRCQEPVSATLVSDGVMEPCVQAFDAYNDGRIDADECVCLMATALQIVLRRADDTDQKR